jgi:hypothetical protein
MVYSEDAIEGLERPYLELVDPAWVAGAAAGLMMVGDRFPARLWSGFINWVYSMIELLGVAEPAEPGCSAFDGDASIGSALDALGGYVSITGAIVKEGLYFRVDLDHVDGVQSLLQEMGEVRPGGFLIGWEELDSFLMLVQLAGPVRDSLREALS